MGASEVASSQPFSGEIQLAAPALGHQVTITVENVSLRICDRFANGHFWAGTYSCIGCVSTGLGRPVQVVNIPNRRAIVQVFD